MTDIKITDVVSAGDDPKRYDLHAEKRVRVTLARNGNPLRVIDIGRRAATFGHTYVGVSGDDRIFQARGELLGAFDRDVDVLREKSVLAFATDSVREIVVRKTARATGVQEVRAVRGDDGWIGSGDDTDAESFDGAAVDGALDFLGKLSAYRFRYDKPITGDPWLEVIVTADEIHTLNIFPQDGTVYPARTSASEFDFNMHLFQASLITDPFGLEALRED